MTCHNLGIGDTPISSPLALRKRVNGCLREDAFLERGGE